MTDRELLELLLQKMNNIEAEQQSMKQDISFIKEKVNSVEAEQESMKRDASLIKETMNNIETEQQSMKKDVSLMKETMATKEDVAGIPAMKMAIFEISDTVKRIEATQEKHELTLDLLSRGSIDQEAAFRRIK
jgi:chromosome segregation ATPase